MNYAVEISKLSKSYNSVLAVKEFDLKVKEGDFFALLGPNGAGKSSTIKVLSTLIKYDSGKVYVNNYELGCDDFKIRSSIGVVFQDHMMDDDLTVDENLLLRGKLYVKNKVQLKKAVDEAIDIVNADDFRTKRYGNLSGGQKRRIDIARALLNTPRILILDEPTTGLDPQTRKNIWDTLLRLKEEHKLTIFLTTHYMEEAALADHIVIIDKGKVVEEGSPATIKDKYCNDELILQVSDENVVNDYLMEREFDFCIQGDQIIVKLEKTRNSIDILCELKDYIRSLEVKKGTLDEAFIKVLGEGKS